MDNLTPDYRFSSSNQPSSISVIWQNPVQSINSSPNSIERSYQDEGSLNHSSCRLRQSFYELSTTWSRHLISTIHFDHDIRTSGQRIWRNCAADQSQLTWEVRYDYRHDGSSAGMSCLVTTILPFLVSSSCPLFHFEYLDRRTCDHDIRMQTPPFQVR
jgi:hypothetical protein